jgi:hypothetical protein
MKIDNGNSPLIKLPYCEEYPEDSSLIKNANFGLGLAEIKDEKEKGTERSKPKEYAEDGAFTITTIDPRMHVRTAESAVPRHEKS